MHSLRDYLKVARERGWLLEIGEEVECSDIPELIHILSSRQKVLLFSRVRGYSCKVVANLVPSQGVLEEILGGGKGAYKHFLDAPKRPGKKLIVRDRPEYIYIDLKDRDLTEFLPILKHYKGDSAAFITTGIVSAMDPETGVIGRGIHRLEYRGGNRLGIALMNPPLKDILPKYERNGATMPVAICIGADPILFLSMALKVPNDVDKLEVTSSLRGMEQGVMESLHQGLDIPADVEYILEGYVDPDLLAKDGPLGEISGYYLEFGNTPTVIIQRLSHRQDPIYHALLPTSLEADSYLTFVSRAHLEERLRAQFPFVLDIHLVKKAFGSSLIIKVGDTEKAWLNNLILFTLSFPMVKKVVVVDEDVDIWDMEEIEWAVITRCRPEEDVIIVPGLKGQPIDPSSRGVYGVGKIGINASYKGKNIDKRAEVTKGDRERIEKVIRSLEDRG